MGHRLIGGSISNKGGHHEDQLAVDLHDNWLLENNTSWQFHDEVDLNVAEDSLDVLKHYIGARDATGKDWGGLKILGLVCF